MRKRFYHQRVCSCSPDKGVMYLETRMLNDFVNHGVHSIRCAGNCGHMALRGMLLGDLCVECHHPYWALKIWKFTLRQIHNKDWDDWIYVHFNTKYVRLQEVISEGNCEIIGRRIDEVERCLGLSDAKGRNSWEYKAGEGWYDYLRYEKYDYCWEEVREDCIKMRDEAIEQQDRERIFSEGQTELVPPCQNFFDYWNNYTPVLQENLHFRIDDWD